MATSSANAIHLTPSPRSSTKKIESVDATYEATASLTPELVVALCGPIGSPLHETANQIQNSLHEFGYSTVHIRLSDLIRLNADYVKVSIDRNTRFSEIDTLIKAGDALRLELGNDVLAKLAIAKIGADRKKLTAISATAQMRLKLIQNARFARTEFAM